MTKGFGLAFRATAAMYLKKWLLQLLQLWQRLLEIARCPQRRQPQRKRGHAPRRVSSKLMTQPPLT